MKYVGFVDPHQGKNWHECKTYFSARVSDDVYQWCEAQESDGEFASAPTPGKASHRFWFERKEDYLLFVLRWGEK